jgi:hypothetical protein
MSTPVKLVGTIDQKLIPQVGYPKMSRDGGLWTLVMVWEGLLENLYRLTPPYRIAISDESVQLEESIKRNFGHLKCANATIDPHDATGYGILTVTFEPPEAPSFEDSVNEEWTTNSVYKEISLTIDDIDESDLTSSPSEGTVQERKAAHLKGLKEQGKATRATSEVQLQFRSKFKGTLSAQSIIGDIGQTGNPPGISGSDGEWIQVAKSIQKSKAEKTEVKTYQFFNETE